MSDYTVLALEFDLSTAKALVPLVDARRFHDEEEHPAGAWVSRALIRWSDGRSSMIYAKSWQLPDGKLGRVGLGAYGDTAIEVPQCAQALGEVR